MVGRDTPEPIRLGISDTISGAYPALWGWRLCKTLEIRHLVVEPRIPQSLTVGVSTKGKHSLIKNFLKNTENLI